MKFGKKSTFSQIVQINVYKLKFNKIHLKFFLKQLYVPGEITMVHEKKSVFFLNY